MRIVSALGALVIAVPAAAAPAQFDLHCAGTKTSYEDKKTTEPFETLIRVDLDKGVYCEGTCRSTRKIAEIAAAFILFESERVDEPGRRTRREIAVDRVTGAYSGTVSYESRSVPYSLWAWDAQCEVGPFSGFPTFDTKF
jgi:hypothetical protein